MNEEGELSVMFWWALGLFCFAVTVAFVVEMVVKHGLPG